MNLNNRMLNIDKKNKKRKKQIKKFFFHKKTFFIEIKNQKIKNVFLYNNTPAPEVRRSRPELEDQDFQGFIWLLLLNTRL